MKTLILGLFFWVLAISTAFGQPAHLNYPSLDSNYTAQELSGFLKYYKNQKNELGIAYTYACYGYRDDLPEKEVVDILRNLLKYQLLIRKNSPKNYWRVQLAILYHYGKNPVANKKSISICDSILNYAITKDTSFLGDGISAMLIKGNILSSLKRKQEAFNCVKSILNKVDSAKFTKSNKAQFAYFLGDYYSDKGKHEQALATFLGAEKLYSKESPNVVFQLYIAKCYRLLNKLDLAKKYLNSVADTKTTTLQRWYHEEYARVYEIEKNHKLENYHWRQYDLTIKKMAAEVDYGDIKSEISEEALLKENENLILKEQLLADENKIQKSSILFSSVVSFLLISLIVMGILWNIERRKTIEKEKLVIYQQAQEEERVHLSRELHDNLGTTLAGIKAYLPEDIAHYQAISQYLDQAYQSVRNVSHLLNSDAVQAVGLGEACRNFIALIDHQTNLIHFNVYGLVVQIPDFEATMIFRVIQELLINSVKHAQASQINVGFHWQSNNLLINVEDNGIGFDIAKLNGGIGLSNVKKRIKALNATIEINSTLTEGTSVLMTIPIVF